MTAANYEQSYMQALTQLFRCGDVDESIKGPWDIGLPFSHKVTWWFVLAHNIDFVSVD